MRRGENRSTGFEPKSGEQYLGGMNRRRVHMMMSQWSVCSLSFSTVDGRSLTVFHVMRCL